MPNGNSSFVVSNYMTRKVITVTETATVRQAIELMVNLKTNGLVVVDASNRIAGILSSWDIISYIVPDYLEEDRHLAAFEASDVFTSRIKEVAEHPITKFMTRKVHTAKLTDSLMEAAILLSENRIRQLPVVDEEGTLVGYINRSDIKRAIGEVLGIMNGAK